MINCVLHSVVIIFDVKHLLHDKSGFFFLRDCEREFDNCFFTRRNRLSISVQMAFSYNGTSVLYLRNHQCDLNSIDEDKKL